MDLRRIQVFVAAAQAANFTQAGRRLRLSQSAVSQQIKLLEEEIGEALFTRTNRHIRLSAAGERLLPTAQEALNAFDLFLERAKSRTGIVGRLSVDASGAALVHLWAAMYHDFGRRFPRVTLDLKTTHATEDSIRQVVSGELDIALAVIPKNTIGLEARVLGVHEAILCAPVSHPLGRRRTISGQDIVGERFLLFEPSVSIRWLADKFFAREKVTPNLVLESNDTHLLRGMIEVGYGIGFLPDWSIQRELKERRLRALPVRGKPLRQEFGLVFRPRTLSSVAKAFIEFCETHRHLMPETAQIGG